MMAESMKALEDAPCLSDAVLLSSGESGGSVGLALTATDTIPSNDAEWATFADPAMVGAAAAGLMVKDAVASGAGILVPSLGLGGERQWRDRAALIEAGWIHANPTLDDAYRPAPPG
jgi:hypothetical protein